MATSLSGDDATIVVGIYLLTSSACVGPDKATTLAEGISSLICSERVLRVPSSIPLATSTIICPSFM